MHENDNAGDASFSSKFFAKDVLKFLYGIGIINLTFDDIGLKPQMINPRKCQRKCHQGPGIWFSASESLHVLYSSVFLSETQELDTGDICFFSNQYRDIGQHITESFFSHGNGTTNYVN